MEKILSDLINSFITGASDGISFFLKDLVKMGLYIETNTDVVTITNSTINFAKLFDICRTFGIILLMLIFLKKGFETYILNTEGDPDVSTIELLKNFIKALITIFLFPFLYDLLANVTIDFSTTLLFGVEATQIDNPNIFTAVLSFLGTSLFISIAGLVAIILYIILYIQFIIRGLEILIMRIGFPIAVCGLLSSNKGSYAPYMKKFIQNAITIVVQVVITKVSILFLLCGNFVFGIASLILALKTPKFLSEFIITTNNMPSIYSINTAKNLISTAAKKVVTKGG